LNIPSLASDLSTGFRIALEPQNLLFGTVGIVLGTAVGVLPGLGPSVAIAILLPVTFGLDPTAAFILFGGIYYGAMYGGSTTSILINTPGDAASSVTTLDGYPMAKKGQGGVALATAAIGSFIGGTFATFMLMLTVTSLGAISLLFGPPEYVALMLLALTLVTAVGGKSVSRTIVALCLGLGLSTIGIDIQTGEARFTFGLPELYGGIDVALGAVGLFAVGEALWLIAAPPSGGAERLPTNRLWLTVQEWRRCLGPWLRGTIVGFSSGVLPGSGAALATFLAYGVEKRLARNPREFGKGAIEGVAAPEAANNAAAGASMVPMLALGIPGSATTAIMLVAFQMYGLPPGPSLLEHNRELVWGLIASLYIANVLLVIINLPLVGAWVQLLKIPKALLTGIMLVFATVGAYSTQGSLGDVLIVWLLGVAAFLLRTFGFPVAPVLLGLVIGPMLEQELRRSLAMASGDAMFFFKRPIVFCVLGLGAGLVTVSAILGRRRQGASVNTDEPTGIKP
jgi:putative tricarboxylic transport membrane protein